MNETPITIVGNLTGDPKLHTFENGDTVAHFTVASTPRFFDRKTQEWKNGETLFLPGSVRRQSAEKVAASLHKGDRVIATGKLRQTSFEAADGTRSKAVELEVDEIGPSLRHATAAVSKASRGEDPGSANF